MARQLEAEAAPAPSLAQPGPARSGKLTDKAALLERTSQDYINRRQRRRYFSAELFGEPAWDLLLDLFQVRLEDKMITVTSACIAADVPLTTALRWLGMLEQQGLVERSRNVSDHRSIWVRLTDNGMAAMIQYTEGCMTRARRAERLAEQANLIALHNEAA
jgi:predicted transcriptional regulator